MSRAECQMLQTVTVLQRRHTIVTPNSYPVRFVNHQIDPVTQIPHLKAMTLREAKTIYNNGSIAGEPSVRTVCYSRLPPRPHTADGGIPQYLQSQRTTAPSGTSPSVASSTASFTPMPCNRVRASHLGLDGLDIGRPAHLDQRIPLPLDNCDLLAHQPHPVMDPHDLGMGMGRERLAVTGENNRQTIRKVPPEGLHVKDLPILHSLKK